MKTVLPDSNVLINLFNGIRDAVPQLSRAEIVYISPVVLGELRSGFGDSRRDRAAAAVLDDFLALPYVQVVPVSETAADYYAGLFRYLRREGRKIPDNDLWIAAQSMELGTRLLSRDAHFADIPNLRVWPPPATTGTSAP